MKVWQTSVFTTALLASAACGNESSQQAASASLAFDKHVVLQALSDGTFNITVGQDGSKCLDVANGSNADGALVQIANCNGGDAQKWQHQGAQWRIFGDKCLNVTDGRDDNGTRLQIWTCGDGDGNGKWTVTGNHLQWKNHNRCLDLTDGKTQDGTPVQLWDCDNNNQNQAWSFKNSQGGSTPQNSGGAQAPVTAAAGLGTAPSGLDVAPYFWTWAKWNNTYAISTLVDARAKAGMQSATIAFGLSGGGCNLSGDITDMGDDIRSYISGGGRIILSFGGAAGTYPWISCSDATALANALDGHMQSLNTHALDFDIEGSNLSTMQHTNVLLDALKILQGRYNDVYVSFTLPVDDNSGLPQSALDVVKGAKDKGVAVSRVNIMTMDFGHGPQNGQDMGDQCINAATATFNQLKGIFGGVADSAIWHMIGITPMIGENDDHYKFTTDNAQKVANFASKKGSACWRFGACSGIAPAPAILITSAMLARVIFSF
jgi:hypothetical protein